MKNDVIRLPADILNYLKNNFNFEENIYKKILVKKNNEEEVYLVIWAKDKPCLIHDHAGNKGKVEVVFGNCLHKIYTNMGVLIKEKNIVENEIIDVEKNMFHTMQNNPNIKKGLVTLHTYKVSNLKKKQIGTNIIHDNIFYTIRTNIKANKNFNDESILYMRGLSELNVENILFKKDLLSKRNYDINYYKNLVTSNENLFYLKVEENHEYILKNITTYLEIFAFEGKIEVQDENVSMNLVDSNSFKTEFNSLSLRAKNGFCILICQSSVSKKIIIEKIVK